MEGERIRNGEEGPGERRKEGKEDKKGSREEEKNKEEEKKEKDMGEEGVEQKWPRTKKCCGNY